MIVFFFNDTATTEIYTLSLHDALPISAVAAAASPVHKSTAGRQVGEPPTRDVPGCHSARRRDRKSTRLNSSHANISYAVFCLKKKNTYSFSYFTSSALLPPLRPTDPLV